MTPGLRLGSLCPGVSCVPITPVARQVVRLVRVLPIPQRPPAPHHRLGFEVVGGWRRADVAHSSVQASHGSGPATLAAAQAPDQVD